jgi:PleD family two-component response regulator
MLIIFSARVVQLFVDEKGVVAIKNVDKAICLAKRSGKSKVVGA